MALTLPPSSAEVLIEHSLLHTGRRWGRPYGARKEKSERKKERGEKIRESRNLKRRPGVWGGMGVNDRGVDDEDEDISIQMHSVAFFFSSFVCIKHVQVNVRVPQWLFCFFYFLFWIVIYIYKYSFYLFIIKYLYYIVSKLNAT